MSREYAFVQLVRGPEIGPEFQDLAADVFANLGDFPYIFPAD